MIVDIHTHIFPDSLAPRALAALLEKSGSAYSLHTDGTLSGLLARMDEWGVDVSVLQPVITKASQLVKLNEFAAACASPRIVPFGGIFPHTEDYKRDIDFVMSLGLRGLKFHVEYQYFVLDDPKMLPLYDYALSRGLILLFHAGFDPAVPPPFRSSPQQFAHLLDELRGGVIIAAHLGGQSQWDDVERHLVGRDIYLDTSTGFEFYSREQFLRIARNHGAQKLLFGSDSPWSDAGRELKTLFSLPLPRKDLEDIAGGNAARLLGLSEAAG